MTRRLRAPLVHVIRAIESGRALWIAVGVATTLVLAAQFWAQGRESQVIESVAPHGRECVPAPLGADTAYVVGLRASSLENVTLHRVELVSAGTLSGLSVARVVATLPAEPHPDRIHSGDAFRLADLWGRTGQVDGTMLRSKGDRFGDPWLVFDLRPRRSGRWHITGLRVTYDVEGRPESQVIALDTDVVAASEPGCGGRA